MAAPLRRIVDHERQEIMSGYTEDGDYIGPPVYRYVEVLECGHRVGVKADAFGETVAVRRRCKKCAKSGE